MNGSAPPPSKVRKRLSGDHGLSSDEAESTLSEDGSQDEDGFTTVLSRRAKRKARNATSGHSSSTIRYSTNCESPTVILVPVVQTDSLSSISRLKLSNVLQTIAPDEIKEVRVNTKKNLIAIDVVNACALDKLLLVTEICSISVRAYVPGGRNTIAGVIQDVDAEITEQDFAALISTTAPIVQFRRFGVSSSVKIVFRSDSLPASVKVGLVRHPVRPYVPRPLQCRKCMRLGHVIGSCPYSPRCNRCGSDHASDICEVEALKCANCLGSHQGNSKECPLLQKEAKVCQRMARDNSSHREAVAQVRRSSRRSRRRQNRSASRSKSPRISSKTIKHTFPATRAQAGSSSGACMSSASSLTAPPGAPVLPNPVDTSAKAKAWPVLPQLQPSLPRPKEARLSNDTRQKGDDAPPTAIGKAKLSFMSPDPHQEQQRSSLKEDRLQKVISALFATLKIVLTLLPPDSPAHGMSSAILLLEGTLHE